MLLDVIEGSRSSIVSATTGVEIICFDPVESVCFHDLTIPPEKKRFTTESTDEGGANQAQVLLPREPEKHLLGSVPLCRS
jgi:hypothetical protein